MFSAERDHGPVAFPRESRLETARLVIDPRMNDAAVAPSLVERQVRLLLQNDKLYAGLPTPKRHGRRQTHDATADNCTIKHRIASRPTGFDLKSLVLLSFISKLRLSDLQNFWKLYHRLTCQRVSKTSLRQWNASARPCRRGAFDSANAMHRANVSLVNQCLVAEI